MSDASIALSFVRRLFTCMHDMHRRALGSPLHCFHQAAADSVAGMLRVCSAGLRMTMLTASCVRCDWLLADTLA